MEILFNVCKYTVKDNVEKTEYKLDVKRVPVKGECVVIEEKTFKVFLVSNSFKDGKQNILVNIMPCQYFE